ncbi:unnamed protein product, partial [Scytosiphon promiscuus]
AGTLALSSVASQIARGEVDARTGREWQPPLGEVPGSGQTLAKPLVGRAGGSRKRAPASGRHGTGVPPAGTKRRSSSPGPSPSPLATLSTNNYSSNGFNNLPDANENYRSWTVTRLREFLSVFRCLDNAGTSGYNKNLLCTLATDVVRLIRNSGVIGENLAFRHPIPDLRLFGEKEKATMPELPAVCLRITEWVALRRYLPEISKSVIVGFLQEVNPLASEDTRVWYRGEQRVLDMGNLSRLWGVPSKAGEMWLGTRRVKTIAQTGAGASYSGDKEYRVRIHLKTEELEESEDPAAMEQEEAKEGEERKTGEPRGPAKSLIALKVLAALCECPAGISGGCSHVAMVLFLCRLLQMGEHELAAFNPSTCTGRACAWIMQHSEGSRSAEKCVLYGKPLAEST